MHPCLYVDEILRVIARHVTERPTWLYMALTCKTLYGPAIDALWEALPGLYPLLPLLPEEALESTEERTSSSELDSVSITTRAMPPC